MTGPLDNPFRISGIAGPEAAGVQSLGETWAAAEQSPTQGYIWFPHRTARAEVNSSAWELEAMDEKARWMYDNSPLAARIVDGIALKVAGKGFTLKHLTRDKRWNRLAEDMWREEFESHDALDMSGMLSFQDSGEFFQAQKILRGEQFAARVDDGRGNAKFFLYDRNDIGEPLTASAEAYPGFSNGVKVDEFDRILQYLIVESDTSAKPIDRLNLIHFRDVTHARAHRSQSWFARALSHLIDITDIDSFTKTAIKSSSEIGYYVTGMGNSGAIEGTMGDVETEGAAGSPLPDGAKVTDMQGGKLLSLTRPGKVEVVADDRPSPNRAEYVWYLLASSVMSFGASPELLLDVTRLSNQQGRLSLQLEQPFIKKQQRALINKWYSSFYLYWLFKKMKSGRLRRPNDPRPWLHGWLVPKDPTLDIGRDGKLEIAQHDKALLTMSAIHAGAGKHFETEADTWLDEKVYFFQGVQKRIASNPGMEERHFFKDWKGSGAPDGGEPGNESDEGKGRKESKRQEKVEA